MHYFSKALMRLGLFVALGGVVLVAPQVAQAARLPSGRIDFSGSADASTTSIDFREYILDAAAGPFGPPPVDSDWVFVSTATGGFSAIDPSAGLPSAVGIIQDVSVPAPTSVTNWLTFGSNFSFELQSIAVRSDLQYVLSGIVTGQGFDPTPFTGEITTQIAGGGVKSFSGIITAVPTPALLPGLSVMAMKVMRRRKQRSNDAAKQAAA